MDQTHFYSILFPFGCTTITTRTPTTTTTSERGTTAAQRTTNMQKSRCSQQTPNIVCGRATPALGDWSRNRQRPQMHAHVQVESRL